MIRTYANLSESLQVAQFYIKHSVASSNIKAELVKSNYQVNVNGNTRNVDYKIVEAMMFALQANVPTKPSRRKAKLPITEVN